MRLFINKTNLLSNDSFLCSLRILFITHPCITQSFSLFMQILSITAEHMLVNTPVVSNNCRNDSCSVEQVYKEACLKILTGHKRFLLFFSLKTIV